MNTIDGIVLVIYVLGIFALAWWTGRNQDGNSPEDQYLASKSLTFTESIASIIATEVSALTFLGLPAFAFDKDLSFVQIYIGAILGRVMIALVFLPKVYDQGLTIYEVMAQGVGLPSGRRTVAGIYAFGKILSVGVRLFSGCILVAAFLGIGIIPAIFLVTLLTMLYTMIGGLKAVVRTDIMQVALFVSGGLLAHYLIPHVANQSWSTLIDVAAASNKVRLFDPEKMELLLYGLLGGFLFDMSTHGVDQDFAQRLTATKSLRTGQWAIVLSSFASIAMGLLFLGVGLLLFGHYHSVLPVDQLLPEGVAKSDNLFAHFIVNHFPNGLKGLMVAGVLAATMSTLDSTINALGATLYNDIQPKFLSNNQSHPIVISLLLLIVAMVASSNDGMLMLGLKIQSWTGGSLLIIFVARVLAHKYFTASFDWKMVLMAYGFGTLGVYLNNFVWQGNWNFNVYLGFLGGLLGIWLCSLVFSTKEAQE